MVQNFPRPDFLLKTMFWLATVEVQSFPCVPVPAYRCWSHSHAAGELTDGGQFPLRPSADMNPAVFWSPGVYCWFQSLLPGGAVPPYPLLGGGGGWNAGWCRPFQVLRLLLYWSSRDGCCLWSEAVNGKVSQIIHVPGPLLISGSSSGDGVRNSCFGVCVTGGLYSLQ